MGRRDIRHYGHGMYELIDLADARESEDFADVTDSTALREGWDDRLVRIVRIETRNNEKGAREPVAIFGSDGKRYLLYDIRLCLRPLSHRTHQEGARTTGKL